MPLNVFQKLGLTTVSPEELAAAEAEKRAKMGLTAPKPAVEEDEEDAAAAVRRL